MKSLIIAFSLLVFTEIQSTLSVDQTVSTDSKVITPTTADEIRKIAITECDAAIENAKSVYRNIMAKINVFRQEVEKERNEKFIKPLNEQTKRVNAIASIILRRASRKHVKSLQDAKNEYNRIVEGTKMKHEKLNEECNSLVEAADDQFVKKYAEMRESKKKIENKNQALLEKVRKEVEKEQKLADERREQAAKEYTRRLGLRKKNIESAEERNSLEAKYEQELDRYEKTVESLEEKWQKTLDGIGIGKEYGAALNNALMEVEKAKKKADSCLMDVRKKMAQATMEAEKTLDERKASANADRLEAEADVQEIRKSLQSYRKEMLERADIKYKQLMVAETELKNAATVMYTAIAQAKSQYDKALKKAKEMEESEKRTTSKKKESA